MLYIDIHSFLLIFFDGRVIDGFMVGRSIKCGKQSSNINECDINKILCEERLKTKSPSGTSACGSNVVLTNRALNSIVTCGIRMPLEASSTEHLS